MYISETELKNIIADQARQIMEQRATIEFYKRELEKKNEPTDKPNS